MKPIISMVLDRVRFCLRNFILAGCVVGFLAGACLFAQQSPDPHTIPVIDGALGSCSAEFTVADEAGAPVYDAKIRVRIAYGFMRTHKLDLEVGTNVDGKARFTGLPDKVKFPLSFTASHAELTGEATDDPATTCTAKQNIVLAKEKKAAGAL